MKLAIMQPYLFPYLGYFQLIHAVDAFVILDDVNYIRKGWINRNNILYRGEAKLITLSVSGASQNRHINELSVGGECKKFLKQIYHAYAKAPRFHDVYPILEEILLFEEPDLARYLASILKRICAYLGMSPAWYMSSRISIEGGLRGEARILAICSALGATHYINLPGGRELYNSTQFASLGIRLSFIMPGEIVYPQFGDNFVPNLSILDVMMFNDQERCRELLTEYRLDG